MDALAFMPAPELAARIRDGSFTAREVTEATIRRIEAIDPQIGAFVELDAESALEQAGAITPGDRRPFAGVPIAIKANTAVAGMCMNFASRFLAGHRPTHSAYLVRRLREAGFVIVGTTNMAEFGILPTTEPRHTGPTRNPWDVTRTPGGSSGGSAAAVAAGLVPIAHANDGGGSLRIPAACCGLVGLKPSRGRVSRGPDLGDSFLACDGVLSRSVAETALLLDVLAGYEPGDATWAPRPAEPYTLAMRRDPGRLRIAMSLGERARRRRRPRGRARAATPPRRCCATSATRSSRRRPRCRRPSCSTCSCRCSDPGSRSGSGSASGSPGAIRTRTRSSRSRARCSSTPARCPRPAT